MNETRLELEHICCLDIATRKSLETSLARFKGVPAGQVWCSQWRGAEEVNKGTWAAFKEFGVKERKP